MDLSPQGHFFQIRGAAKAKGVIAKSRMQMLRLRRYIIWYYISADVIQDNVRLYSRLNCFGVY